MFAGPQRGEGELMVGASRRADVDQVDVRVGQQVRKQFRGPDALHIQLERFVRTDVAADLRKIAIQMTAARIAESGHARALHLAISLDVRGGHEAETDNANVDHKTFSGRKTQPVPKIKEKPSTADN